jgi:glycosyltransferase involved in cell wall biosynthesis
MSRTWLAKRLWMTVHGRPCLAGATAVLFSTEAERDKARPVYHGGNSVVIPWPVDLPDRVGREAARVMLRRSVGLGDTGRVLLWMGRYDSLKRPLEVVEAFAAGASQDWVLVMAGLPGDLPRERVAAAARRTPGRIYVWEAVQGDEKATLLLGADAFISLSWRENFGYAMAEAMAYGLPVVLAPDHDLVAAGVFGTIGYACADHSSAAAAAAVRRLCTAPASECAEAGTRAREWVAANLSRKRFGEEVAALLDEHRPEPAEARRLSHAASLGSSQTA